MRNHDPPETHAHFVTNETILCDAGNRMRGWRLAAVIVPINASRFKR